MTNAVRDDRSPEEVVVDFPSDRIFRHRPSDRVEVSYLGETTVYANPQALRDDLLRVSRAAGREKVDALIAEATAAAELARTQLARANRLLAERLEDKAQAERLLSLIVWVVVIGLAAAALLGLL